MFAFLNVFRRQHPEERHEQFSLDAVAAALHGVRGRPKPRRIVSSVKLAVQFPGDFGAKDWRRLERELDCLLPPLENGNFPHGWETVFDLANYVAEKRVELEPPREVTVTAWRKAQIFVGVRDCLGGLRSLPVDPQAVHREAFVQDFV